jgi:hypothetical protein
MSYPEAESITYLCVQLPDTKIGGNETVAEFQDRVERDMCYRKSHYFIEKTFHRAEYDFNRIMTELTYTAEEIVDNLDKPLHYWRQDRSACWQFGKFCDFYKCCESRVFPGDLPLMYKKADIDKIIYHAK